VLLAHATSNPQYFSGGTYSQEEYRWISAVHFDERYGNTPKQNSDKRSSNASTKTPPASTTNSSPSHETKPLTRLVSQEQTNRLPANPLAEET
jgi:hypothetical protein